MDDKRRKLFCGRALWKNLPKYQFWYLNLSSTSSKWILKSHDWDLPFINTLQTWVHLNLETSTIQVSLISAVLRQERFSFLLKLPLKHNNFRWLWTPTDAHSTRPYLCTVKATNTNIRYANHFWVHIARCGIKQQVRRLKNLRTVR